MKIVADFHVHSKYARATSDRCEPEGLAEGAKTKGINVIATGDFTHPTYFELLKQKLKEEKDGLYPYNGISFLLSVEISLIYSAKSKTGITREMEHVRKMHHIVLAPNFDVAKQINDVLGKRGNLKSDGRPILGISSPEFAEIMFGISKDIVIVPGHIWTPWFSIFGSASGVDTVKEAFEDKADKIFALETGLSSDPIMNWMISGLDRYTLVSNSDAHSLDKLGREANVFELNETSYKSIINAIKTRKGFVKTYEFYPEEGKYHYDGHRNCNVLLDPSETKKYNNICPKCRKKLTIGVLNRVYELADRKYGFKPENAVPFQHIVPLKTVIAKALGKTEITQIVVTEYSKLIRYFGNEFAVYEASEDQLRLATNNEIANALIKVNTGNVKWIPGHDGVFGDLILDDKNIKHTKDRKQKRLDEF